ncbi:branched-chain amino acid ABC transporter permease, partial [Halobacteriales archaeon QH_2_65_14]
MIDTVLVIGEIVDLLTSPGELTAVLIEGFAKGSVFLMIAAGLTLIFGLMDVINFAHGAFTMYGAYVAGGTVLALGLAGMGFGPTIFLFLVAMGLVFLALMVFGIVLEVSLIRKLYEYPPIYQILLTFGIGITMEEFMRMLVEVTNVNDGRYQLDWTEPERQTLPTALRSTHDLGFIEFAGIHVLQIALGVLTIVAIWAFLNRTRYGLFVRAGVEDEEMAKALGINIKRTFTVVFGIGAGVAGAAGVMLMWDPLWDVSVPLALDVLLPAFVIVIVGGLGSFKGTVVASYLVGMIDAFGTWAF